MFEEKKKKRRKNIAIFSFLILFIVALIVLLSFMSPEEFVEKIGVKNGYLLAFLVSLFGGFSGGGSVTFISVLATLAAGGLDPIYLTLIAGFSLAIGDTIMFYTGKKGRELIQGKWDAHIKKWTERIERRENLQKSIPLLAYLYMSAAPIPNDILLLSLAAIEYPTKKMIAPIILGDLTFSGFVVFFAATV